MNDVTEKQKIAEALELKHGDDKSYADTLANQWREVGNDIKEERYITFAGEYSLQTGAYQISIEQFKNAKTLVDRLDLSDYKKKRKHVHLCQRIGEAHLALENYTEARSSFLESLNLCEAVEDTIAIAVSLGHLANLEFFRDNFSEAKKIYERALMLYRQEDNQVGIERTVNYLNKIDAQ